MNLDINRFYSPLQNKETHIFKNKIKYVDYFLFDFDGTIYPDNLLLNLTLNFLDNYNGENSMFKLKHKALIQLIKDKNKYNFLELSLLFAKILKNIPCNELNKKIPSFLNRCYPHSLNFIRTIQQNNKKCFLVSLTSEAIATEVVKQFGFDDYWCRKLERNNHNGIEVFSGKYSEDVSDLLEFKKSCLSKFGIGKEEHFLMAGNGFEDIMLFDLAHIKIGINPEKKLLNNNINFDMILKGKKDPWQDFAKIIQQHSKLSAYSELNK